MTYLRINNSKAYFQTGDENWKEIDQISKDDLMTLLDKAVSSEFQIDQFESDKIQNKAHQIIYRNLHEKFSDLLENKNRFKDESEQLYKSAIERYNDNSSNTAVEEDE